MILKKFYHFKKTLLEKAKTLLNKKGILIYMVCSFFDEEGKQQINNFLKKNNNFSLMKFSSKGLDYIINALINKKGFYYVVPSQLKNSVLIDGFFAAKIKKK